MASRNDKPEPVPAPKDPAASPSFEVGHDGKIDGIYRGRDSRRTWTDTDSAQLELQAQSTRKGTILPDLPVPRRAPASPRKKWIAIAAIVAALFVPLAGLWGVRLWTDYQNRQIKASGLIVIDSVPSNARLFINGKEVGRTPYVAPNTFAPGTIVPARIVYPGAQEWTGTFQGGVDTSFTADLAAE